MLKFDNLYLNMQPGGAGAQLSLSGFHIMPSHISSVRSLVALTKKRLGLHVCHHAADLKSLSEIMIETPHALVYRMPRWRIWALTRTPFARALAGH